jgi:hypothetical protein
VKQGMQQHLHRMAKLYCCSIVPSFLTGDEGIPGLVSSVDCANRAARLLQRAWEIGPSIVIANDFYMLFYLADFNATALFWLGEVERMVAKTGNTQALTLVKSQRLEFEADGNTRDPSLAHHHGFPTPNTPGLKLQFQPAPVPVPTSVPAPSRATVESTVSLPPSPQPVPSPSAMRASPTATSNWDSAPFVVRAAKWINVLSVVGCLSILWRWFNFLHFFREVELLIFLGLVVWLLIAAPRRQTAAWHGQLILLIGQILIFYFYMRPSLIFFSMVLNATLLFFWFRPEVKSWFRVR